MDEYDIKYLSNLPSIRGAHLRYIYKHGAKIEYYILINYFFRNRLHKLGTGHNIKWQNG